MLFLSWVRVYPPRQTSHPHHDPSLASPTPQPPMATVILGAGIISLSTAYYTSLSSSTPIHILDTTQTLFSSASGRAAGFLAKDWFSRSVSPLGELSFALHADLARTHSGVTNWGYSGSTGISLSATGHSGARGHDWLRDDTSRAEASKGADTTPILPAWLVRSGGAVEVISTPETTAQVDPLRLCHFLLAQCRSRGVEVHYPARATRLQVCGGVVTGVYMVDSVTGVEELICCDKVVIACGAWSAGVFSGLFPGAAVRLPVGSLAGHSVVLRSPRWRGEDDGCHAVFTVSEEGWAPEVFSRRGGEIYIAGVNSRVLPVPGLAEEAVVREGDVEVLVRAAKELLGEDVEVIKSALCFRPVTGSGRPIIGKVRGEDVGLVDGEGGVWVAAGHGPWGIALSLGTGKVMAEMMGGGKTSVDVRELGVWE